MGAAGYDLQVGYQRAVIQGRRHLADTAAQCVDSRTVGVCGCLPVTLFCGTLTNGGVEVEFFTGSKNHAVNGGTGQPEVGGTPGFTGVCRLIFTQYITEEKIFQLRAMDFR